MNKQERMCRILVADAVSSVGDLEDDFFVGPRAVVDYNPNIYTCLHRAAVRKDIYIQDKDMLLEAGKVYEWTTTWMLEAHARGPTLHRVMTISKYTAWKHIVDTIGRTILAIPRALYELARKMYS